MATKKLGVKAFKRKCARYESMGWYIMEIMPFANFAVYCNPANNGLVELGKRPTQ